MAAAASSAGKLSPYDRHMTERGLKLKVAEYLTTSEALTKYTRVSCVHRSDLDRLVYLTALTISASKLGTYDVQRAPNLQSLRVIGNQFPENLANPLGARSIAKLVVNAIDLPPTDLPRLLAVLPGIQDLTLQTVNISPVAHLSPATPLTVECKNNLKMLRRLDLSLTNVHPAGAVSLLQCSQEFESVNLANQTISNAIFDELARNTKLTNLNLSDTHGIPDYHLLARGCTSLTHFTPGEMFADSTTTAERIYNTQMRSGDEAAVDVARSALRNATAQDTDTLLAVLRANPKMEYLDLTHCPGILITDAFIEQLTAMLPRLKTLILPRFVRFTNTGFRTLISRLPLLESLDLGTGMSVTSLIALKEIKDHCPNLRELKMIGVRLDNEFIQILGAKSELRALSIPGCKGFYAGALQSLVQLEKLNIFGCEGLEDQIIIEIVDNLPKLKILLLAGWNEIAQEVRTHINKAVREGRSAITRVHVSNTPWQ